MSSSSDSDQHRAVIKNGKEHIQDQQIRQMRQDFQLFQEEDREVHAKLLSGVQSTDSRMGKYIFAGRIIWAAMAIAMTVVGSLFGWIVSEIGTIDDRAQHIESLELVHAQRDGDMRQDLILIQSDLRDLRKLVQQHQINKREHNTRTRSE